MNRIIGLIATVVLGLILLAFDWLIMKADDIDNDRKDKK